ncbi:MAG: hypothetical protein GQ474_05595 [Sulfurimonas sp.]|nr:hypothetical protein [Sulfurimonas sp.]
MDKIDLFIIGAQKTGSTSIFNYLKKHENVISHEQRELTFFLNDFEYENRNLLEEKYLPELKNKSKDMIVLGKSVMNMYSLKTIERLHQNNPEMKLIVIVRNPIKRAYSYYWYARRRGWEEIQTFEEALKIEDSRIEQYGWDQARNNCYKFNGLYAKHLTDIFKIFPREQVLIFTDDDLKNKPKDILSNVFGLFNLKSIDVDTNKHYNKSKIAKSEGLARLVAKFFASQSILKKLIRSMLPHQIAVRLRHAILSVNEKDFTPPLMNSSTKQELIDFFKEDIYDLEKIINKNLEDWLK